MKECNMTVGYAILAKCMRPVNKKMSAEGLHDSMVT